MDRNTHAAILAGILSGREDQAVVSDNLTVLSEDYAGVLAELELTKAENATLKTRNQALTEQNMKLFLKVGNVPEPEPEPEPETRTFESLFDTNGKLR